MSALRTIRPSGTPPKLIMPVVNTMVRLILRSPLQGLLNQTMLLLTYTGRKSGKRYQIPLGYRREGNRVILVAGNPWWVNVAHGAAVTLWLAGEELQGFALPVAEKAQAAAALTALIERMPHLAKMYDVTLTQAGQPDQASVEAAISHQVVVFVTLNMQR
jgi:hypothetical protein